MAIYARLNKAVDYKSLKLPKQTKAYVPKFKAIVELIINAKKYDIQLPKFPNRSVLGQISLDGQIEIFAFSEFSNLKPEFVYKLNAGFTKWASPPGKTTTFNIPIEFVEPLNKKRVNLLKPIKLTGLLTKFQMEIVSGRLLINMTLRSWS